jgi:uncharacterized transporter YbjL
MKHGDPAAAICLLRTAVASSQRASFELHRAIFVGMMAHALAATGRIDDALSAVNEALEESKACESLLVRTGISAAVWAVVGACLRVSVARKRSKKDLSAVPHRDGRRLLELEGSRPARGSVGEKDHRPH